MDVQEQLLLKMIRQSPLLKLTRYTVYVRGEEVHSFLEVSRDILEVYWRYTTRDLQMYVMCILAFTQEVYLRYQRYFGGTTTSCTGPSTST